MRVRPSLFSRNYVLVCLATFAFYTSTMMLVPIFPEYLRRSAGASDAMVGLFIGLFTVLAILMRPWVGRELTRRPRRLFMAAGGFLTAASTAGYWATSAIAPLVAIRLAHGAALACFYTAASTLAVDLAPEERRGEAISYFSMFLYLGLAGGPALGLALQPASGFGPVFAVSAALGLACAGVTRAIREPAVQTPETLEMERRQLIHRSALFPAFVVMLAAVGYSSAVNFTADFARAGGVSGGGWYFPTLALSVIVTRAFAGRASDRYGRVAVALPSLTIFACALALESVARSTAPLLVSAALFGVGFGAFFPSMMAFVADRVPPHERGSAMATFITFFDVGFGAGSLLLGAAKGAWGYPAMYRTASGFVCGGVLVLAAAWGRKASRAGVAASESS